MEETMEDTMEGTMEDSMDMEEPNLEAEANCTMWNVSCLQADLEDPYLNPWLWEASSLCYWGEGVALPIAAAIGVTINSFLLGAMVCRLARPSDWLITLLAATNMLLLIMLTVVRTPSALDIHLLHPSILTGCSMVERALTVFMTFVFLIFVGDRHLCQLEKTSYTWSKPVLFSLVVAVLAAVPRLWEVRVDSLAWDQVDMVLSGEGRQLGLLGEEVEVVRRTELFHNLVYKNMVRHLVPLLTSQVATIWLLPVLFLHSRDVAKVVNRQRKRRRGGPGDRLTPILCLAFILLTLPSLADLVLQVLLYRPPLILHTVTTLSLALLLLLQPLLTISLDRDIRRRLTSCSILRHRMAVPTEDF